MPTIQLEEAREWTVIPEDTIITVRCTETKLEEVDGKYGKWHKLNFTFEIVDAPEPWSSKDDVIGSKIWGGVPFKFEDDPDNPLKTWVEALLGIDTTGQLGFELNTDDLTNKTVRAVVRNFEKRNGKVGHGIESLLPLGSGQMSAPQSSDDAASAAAAAAVAAVAAPPTDNDIPF